MTETPQQYIQRILGHAGDHDPLKVQATTAKKIKSLIKGLKKTQAILQENVRFEPGEIKTVVLVPLAGARLIESFGPSRSLDLPGK